MKKLQTNGLTLIVSSPARHKNVANVRVFPPNFASEMLGPDEFKLIGYFILKNGSAYLYDYPPVATSPVIGNQQLHLARDPNVGLPIGGVYFNGGVRQRTANKRFFF